MKRFLLAALLTLSIAFVQAQGTYYWVGNPGDSINVTSNWNTDITGTGSSRTSNTNVLDILIFDGTNLGNPVPAFMVTSSGGASCGQLKFVNNAAISLNRSASGTTTITIAGATGDDFVIESGCSLTLSNGPGSVVLAMAATNTGRVSGNFSMVTGLQAAIRNTTAGAPGSLVFTNGSNFFTNITAASAAYAFGNSTQSSEKWVLFQAGANLYYDGGYSPMGSSATFQPVDFQPGSNLIVRVSNPLTGFGTFLNRKAYANIIVQNGATLTADGTVNRIDNLTVSSGSTFITHTSGQTVVLGNITVDGALTSAATSTNEVVLAGNTTQTISGTGTITIPSLTVADQAAVMLNKSITVNRSATINGQIDFSTSQLTGAGTFTARSSSAVVNGTGNTTTGSYLITGVTGANNFNRGISVTGAGLSPNTTVVSYTAAFDSIYISRPALATASNVTLSFSSTASTLITANTAGFDPVNGSVAVVDTKFYGDGINYTINAPTVAPFGISTAATMPIITTGNVLFNAPVTTNASVSILGSLQATTKATIRPLDTLRLLPSATLAGSYSSAAYFVTGVNAAGDAGIFRRDGMSGSSLFPIGTSANYLPVTLNPATGSDFAINVFSGITTNGLPTGTPFTSLQKQTVVDAVWNINRAAGTGNSNVQLQWMDALEGSTMATFANSEIGIIKNTGSSWSLPFGVGDNTANTADTLFSSFGQFSVGARPPANPFVFNPISDKTYGNPDFSAGVISSNTTSPITYTSSNTGVATIINSNIHIVGVGITTITAQQATDGFYPAANISQNLTVAKAPLTIKADRKTKPEGDPNPALTATYTGFVLAETASVLSTPAVLATTATTISPAGNYLITVSGATAANYAITFINDSLIIKPRSPQTITFAAPAIKTYGAADFGIGALSTNNTIPITYTSSNTSVATIVGNNIHIVGAGTSTITASQAGSDLFFPAPNVSQTLTVNKAALTIRAMDTTKIQGEANPPFRITYTGFVLGHTPAVLATQPVVSTTAGTNSAPGYYSIDVVGTTAANYNITQVPGRLTIYPATGTGTANLQAFMSSSNTLTVRVYSAEPDLANIVVYDLSGRPMALKNVFLAPGFITATIPLNQFASGIYTVQVIGKITNLKKTISIIR